MPNPTRTSPKIRPQARDRDRWLIPLPHPSWSGEAALRDQLPPLAAAEFWNRLGL
jgi:hypothetical protein